MFRAWFCRGYQKPRIGGAMLKNFRKRSLKHYRKLKRSVVQSPLQLYVIMMTAHASTLMARYFK